MNALLSVVCLLATVKTPAESSLFEKFTDPKSGAVSYLLKDGLVGSWNQQGLYFTAKSMSDDGRFLVFDASADERVSPVTNYIDCAKTKAVVDLEKDRAFLLPGTDGGIPFFDSETARLYYIRRDKTQSVEMYGLKMGPLVPSVFMRDLRSDPFREIKLCDIPAVVRRGITNVLDYCTHLTLTRDRRKAFLEVKGDMDFTTWKGICRHGLLDLETGAWNEWGSSNYYFNHGQINPVDETVALGANDGAWHFVRPGEAYPRLRVKWPNGTEKMVEPAFNNYATHELWNPQGTGFTYGSQGCVFYDLATGRSEVYCPLRCNHPSVSGDSRNRYVLVDCAAEDCSWRGSDWRVGLWDRLTGRYVDIYTRGGELCPCDPESKRSKLHPDAHPAFNCRDRYVVSTYTRPGAARMTVMVTPVEPLTARLAAETDETDVWDLGDAVSLSDREAEISAEESLAARELLNRKVIERTGERLHGSGRCFIRGARPRGARKAYPGEGCVMIFGGKAYLWGDVRKAVELFFERCPAGRRVRLREGTFWTTGHPVFNVRDYGAKGDGVTRDTKAIQRAIDAAHAAGGGEVVLPKGRFLTGTLYLKSNVELNLRGGSWLVGSRDPADYNRWDFCPQNSRSLAENHEGGHLLVCLEQTNVVVRGTGVIDGNGQFFMTNGYDPARIGKRTGTNGLGGVNPQDAIKWRPAQMLWFCESKDIRLEGFTAWNAPYWSILLHGCENVVARYLQIRTSRENPRVHNGDGLNIDCCRHVRVSDCYIETSDDSLCLRANGTRLLHAPEETCDVTVRDCTLSSLQEAFRIGVGDGPIHDCLFSGCVIRDSVRGINFSSTWFPSRGCSFRNISFENIVCDCTSSFLRIHRLKSTDPDVESLHFRNIRGTQGRPSYIWSRKGKPFKDITLENIDVNGVIEVMNVEGFRLENSTLRRMELTPLETAERDEEIERFDTLLY